MKTLTNPIKVPNIVKWSVTRCELHEDDSPPWARILVQLQGSGGSTYGTREIIAYDNLPCTYIFANPTPSGYFDLVVMGSQTFSSAFTTISAAATGPGTRSSQLLAVESALLSIGLVDATLAGA